MAIDLFIISGSLFASIGFFLLYRLNTDSGYLWLTFLALFSIGIGMTLFAAPITKAAMSQNNKFAGSASGLNNTVARISGLVAVAVLGALWAAQYEAEMNAQLETFTHGVELNEALQNARIFGQFEVPENLQQSDQEILSQTIKSSLNSGFGLIMLVCSVICALATLLGVLFLPKKTIK